MKRILYVILDGLADRPLAEFGDRTPLEAAQIPNLNKFAASGRQGTVITVGKGIAPESDVAVMAPFGNDPPRTHAGRGPPEGLGGGLPLLKGGHPLRGDLPDVGRGGRVYNSPW